MESDDETRDWVAALDAALANAGAGADQGGESDADEPADVGDNDGDDIGGGDDADVSRVVSPLIADYDALQGEWHSEFCVAADLLVDRLNAKVRDNMALVYDAQTGLCSLFHFKPKTEVKFCSRTFRIEHLQGYRVRLDDFNRGKAICAIHDRVVTVTTGSYIVHGSIGLPLLKGTRSERDVVPTWVWRLQRMWGNLLQSSPVSGTTSCFLCKVSISNRECTNCALCLRVSHTVCAATVRDNRSWQALFKSSRDKYLQRGEPLTAFIPFNDNSICGLCKAGLGM